MCSVFRSSLMMCQLVQVNCKTLLTGTALIDYTHVRQQLKVKKKRLKDALAEAQRRRRDNQGSSSDGGTKGSERSEKSCPETAASDESSQNLNVESAQKAACSSNGAAESATGVKPLLHQVAKSAELPLTRKHLGDIQNSSPASSSPYKPVKKRLRKSLPASAAIKPAIKPPTKSTDFLPNTQTVSKAIAPVVAMGVSTGGRGLSRRRRSSLYSQVPGLAMLTHGTALPTSKSQMFSRGPALGLRAGVRRPGLSVRAKVKPLHPNLHRPSE